MQTTISALDSFLRARLIDSVTVDDDKITSVYKLDEVCELARGSPVDVVRSMVQYIGQRLEVKSPYVKLKALRLIKYATPRAGREFKREVQKHSNLIRTLCHFKGQSDPLKGDAPNKAVRNMANETLQVMFSEEDIKPASYEGIGRRMEGFGKGIASSPYEAKRGPPSSFNDVVEYGTASLAQGLSMIRDAAQTAGIGNNQRPLRRSLHSPDENESRYEGPGGRYNGPESFSGGDRHFGGFNDGASSYSSHSGQSPRDNLYGGTYGVSKGNESMSTPWGTSSEAVKDHKRGHVPSGEGRGHPDEERLVEAITAPGGVRVQPTREALSSFLSTASKLDGVALAVLLETKLQAKIWQVKLKALCVLEAVLRHRSDNPDVTGDAICIFFEEDAGAVIDCLESPQASLREKAKRVLELLGMGLNTSSGSLPQEAPSVPQQPQAQVAVPDLLDITEPDLTREVTSSTDAALGLVATPGEPNHKAMPSPATPVASLAQSDLLGTDSLLGGGATSAVQDITETAGRPKDPFVGLSVHGATRDQEAAAAVDMFSGLALNGGSEAGPLRTPGYTNGVPRAAEGLFEGLSLSDSNQSQHPAGAVADVASTACTAADPLASLVGPVQSGSIRGQQRDPFEQQLRPGLGAGLGQGMSQLVGNVAQHQQGVQLPGLGGIPSPYHATAALTPSGAGGVNLTALQHQWLQQQMMYMQALSRGQFMPAQPPAPPSVMHPFAAGLPFPQHFSPRGVPAGLGALPLPGGIGLEGGGLPQNMSPGGGGVHNDGFDFSGDPTVRIQAPDVKKEETKAFDFVNDHLSIARGPQKGASLRSL